MKIRGVDFGPKALIFAALEHDGKALFLSRKDTDGMGYYELPWVYGTTRSDPIGQIAEAYRKKTDIKVHTGELFIETEIEVDGKMMPCLVFKMEPQQDDLTIIPGGGYTGFRWMSFEEARKENHSAQMRWLDFM